MAHTHIAWHAHHACMGPADMACACVTAHREHGGAGLHPGLWGYLCSAAGGGSGAVRLPWGYPCQRLVAD